MFQKRFTIPCLALCLSLALTGCGGGNSPTYSWAITMPSNGQTDVEVPVTLGGTGPANDTSQAHAAVWDEDAYQATGDPQDAVSFHQQKNISTAAAGTWTAVVFEFGDGTESTVRAVLGNEGDWWSYLEGNNNVQADSDFIEFETAAAE